MRLALLAALAWIVAPLCACRSAAAPGEEHVLENASARLVLKGNRIVSLFDKERSIEHVSPRADPAAGMFRVGLVKGIRPTLDLDATGMLSRVARQTASELDMEFEHAEVTVRLKVKRKINCDR